jgi:rhamnosyltransferase subunit B
LMLRCIGLRGRRMIIDAIIDLFDRWIGLTALSRKYKIPFNSKRLMREGRYFGAYSSLLGGVQPDYSSESTVGGFIFYDQSDNDEHSHELNAARRFIAEGPAPVVFTLGSSAVWNPGNFFEVAREAVKRLDLRAILLVGENFDKERMKDFGGKTMTCRYVPHSQIFHRASVIVHHGGIGTVGQALRGGRPQIIVPFSHDQPDNADRVVRAGVGRVISRNRYTADRLVIELQAILGDALYVSRAADAAAFTKQEDGISSAVSAVEKIFVGRSSADVDVRLKAEIV